MNRHKIQNLKDLDEARHYLEQYQPLGDLAEQEPAHLDVLDRALRTLGPGHQAPRPIWIGVRDDAGSLIAALHASSPLDYAVEMLSEVDDLPSVMHYLTQNLMLEELAVHEHHRRQGIASALIRRAHSRAYATTNNPEAFTVVAPVHSLEEALLMQSSGYSVGSDLIPEPEDRTDARAFFANPGPGWAAAILANLERG